MSQRRDLEKHRHSLIEIRDIMNAMKNLAYMEMRKISGFLDAQHAVVKHVEKVASDFLSFYPEVLTENTNNSFEVYLLVGTERGFCGDFNHALQDYFKNIEKPDENSHLHIIAIGRKLQILLGHEEHATSFIEGASVAEEVNNVLNQVVDQLSAIQQQYGSLNLYVIYHDSEHHLVNQQLLPSFQSFLRYQSTETIAPELNIEPKKLLFELSSHYLFAALYEILYTSLMAESRLRFSSLEGTVQQIDRQSDQLQRQGNILRQEEIIEEIEVILLSAANLD